MLGTVSLNIVCFEFSYCLVHLLTESLLLPCCISDGGSCGCWAVDVLLFLKLFLQVSLLVHFLEYFDGLGNILI